ncbi:MAG TPA: hypothetical protein VMW38_04730 [Terriglobia bacterium]|nr:hypothetical protein [Terriglobia bacterium]
MTDPFTRIVYLKAGLVVWLLFCLLPGVEAKESEKERGEDAFALLVGTCFNEKGLSMRAVAIVVETQISSEQKLKRKKWTTATDARGEFALRLPAGQARFLVKASKDGYESQERTVDFSSDERQNILFNMEPLPSKKSSKAKE